MSDERRFALGQPFVSRVTADGESDSPSVIGKSDGYFVNTDGMVLTAGGTTNEQVTAPQPSLTPADLIALRPYLQHKERCKVHSCATCDHTDGVHGPGWKAGDGYRQICKSFKAEPCSCGLDTLITRLSSETEKEKKP